MLRSLDYDTQSEYIRFISILSVESVCKSDRGIFDLYNPDIPGKVIKDKFLCERWHIVDRIF